MDNSKPKIQYIATIYFDADEDVNVKEGYYYADEDDNVKEVLRVLISAMVDSDPSVVVVELRIRRG